MNFSSHIDVTPVAVRLVNALTPSEAHGRPVLPPDGAALAALATEALRSGRADTRDVTADEAAELGDFAWALRLVFADVCR